MLEKLPGKNLKSRNLKSNADKYQRLTVIQPQGTGFRQELESVRINSAPLGSLAKTLIADPGTQLNANSNPENYVLL